MKKIQKTLQTYAKPETDIVLLEFKRRLLQNTGDTLDDTFDTFSGGGDDIVIGDGPDPSEDDQRSNVINVWDTL